jgi:hypothetical protein
MNLWDILILLAVAAAVCLGVIRTQKRKRGGGTCCGCSCESCGLYCRNPDKKA